MGGSLETWIDKNVGGLLSKIPALKELGTKKGMEVASAHIFGHFSLGMMVNLCAMKWGWLIACIHLPLYFLVVLAENNEHGRVVDWITRSFGWACAAVIGILFLI